MKSFLIKKGAFWWVIEINKYSSEFQMNWAELKAALAYNRSSFADFFNKAAEEYLSNRKADKQKKSKSKYGGIKNG